MQQERVAKANKTWLLFSLRFTHGHYSLTWTLWHGKIGEYGFRTETSVRLSFVKLLFCLVIVHLVLDLCFTKVKETAPQFDGIGLGTCVFDADGWGLPSGTFDNFDHIGSPGGISSFTYSLNCRIDLRKLGAALRDHSYGTHTRQLSTVESRSSYPQYSQ